MILSEVSIQQRPTQNHEIFVNSAEKWCRAQPIIHSFVIKSKAMCTFLA